MYMYSANNYEIRNCSPPAACTMFYLLIKHSVDSYRFPKVQHNKKQFITHACSVTLSSQSSSLCKNQCSKFLFIWVLAFSFLAKLLTCAFVHKKRYVYRHSKRHIKCHLNTVTCTNSTPTQLKLQLKK